MTPNKTYQIPEEITDSIFRLYDIRGIVGKELDANVYYAMGRSIASECRQLGESKLAVGRDGRCSSEELQAALMQGAMDTGVDVIDIGLVPTGALYFAVQQLDLQSGVMVTGSHNPANYNGIKTIIQNKTISADGVQQLKKRYQARDFIAGNGKHEHYDILPQYVDTIAADIKLAKPLHIVVDAGNGAGAVIAEKLYQRLGCKVTPLYCEIDGNFPNHHPDPTIADNLQDLIDTVKAVKADCGLALDGDADRLGVVTNHGEIIWPDRLMMLFAKDVLSKHPNSTIVYDVKCSQHLTHCIKDNGGKPLMWRTGHSILKAKMLAEKAPLAGELSGHIFFNDGRWFGFDDGLYVGARFLECLAATNESASELCSTLAQSYDTPELKIHLTEEQKQPVMQALAQHDFASANIIKLDGLRVEYPYGWALVRPSNTTPCLTVRFEGKTPADLQKLQQQFNNIFKKIDPTLDLPF